MSACEHCQAMADATEAVRVHVEKRRDAEARRDSAIKELAELERVEYQLREDWRSALAGQKARFGGEL